jgi:hypothetical protein
MFVWLARPGRGREASGMSEWDLSVGERATADKNIAGIDELILSMQKHMRDLLDGGVPEVVALSIVAGMVELTAKEGVWPPELALATVVARLVMLKVQVKR